MFSLYNQNYLCIVDFHSKFPVIKMTEGLSVDNLILACGVTSFRVWAAKEDNVRCRDNLISEKILKIMEKIEYRASSSSIILPPSKQQTSRRMNEID